MNEITKEIFKKIIACLSVALIVLWLGVLFIAVECHYHPGVCGFGLGAAMIFGFFGVLAIVVLIVGLIWNFLIYRHRHISKKMMIFYSLILIITFILFIIGSVTQSISRRKDREEAQRLKRQLFEKLEYSR